MSGSGNWGKVRSAVQTFGPRLDEKEARIKDLMRTVAEQHHTGLEDEQRRTKVEQELRCVLFDDCCSRCGHALVRRGVVAVEGTRYTEQSRRGTVQAAAGRDGGGGGACGRGGGAVRRVAGDGAGAAG